MSLKHSVANLIGNVGKGSWGMRKENGSIARMHADVFQRIKILRHQHHGHDFLTVNAWDAMGEIDDGFSKTGNDGLALTRYALSCKVFCFGFGFCCFNDCDFLSFGFLKRCRSKNDPQVVFDAAIDLPQTRCGVNLVHGISNLWSRFSKAQGLHRYLLCRNNVGHKCLNNGKTKGAHTLCQLRPNVQRDLFFALDDEWKDSTARYLRQKHHRETVLERMIEPHQKRSYEFGTWNRSACKKHQTRFPSTPKTKIQRQKPKPPLLDTEQTPPNEQTRYRGSSFRQRHPIDECGRSSFPPQSLLQRRLKKCLRQAILTDAWPKTVKTWKRHAIELSEAFDNRDGALRYTSEHVEKAKKTRIRKGLRKDVQIGKNYGFNSIQYKRLRIRLYFMRIVKS